MRSTVGTLCCAILICTCARVGVANAGDAEDIVELFYVCQGTQPPVADTLASLQAIEGLLAEGFTADELNAAVLTVFGAVPAAKDRPLHEVLPDHVRQQAAAAAVPAAPAAPLSGCGNDLDCKGDRICEEGECVDPPSSSAAVLPAAPPPAQPAPPASPASPPPTATVSTRPLVINVVQHSNLDSKSRSRFDEVGVARALSQRVEAALAGQASALAGKELLIQVDEFRLRTGGQVAMLGLMGGGDFIGALVELRSSGTTEKVFKATGVLVTGAGSPGEDGRFEDILEGVVEDIVAEL